MNLKIFNFFNGEQKQFNPKHVKSRLESVVLLSTLYILSKALEIRFLKL